MEELNEKASSLKDMLRRLPAEQLQERVYVCVANGCILLTAYKKKKGAKGWSGSFVNEVGDPILSSKQQEAIEHAFATAPWLREIFEQETESEVIQEGGSLPTLTSDGKVGVEDTESYLPNPKDLSLDLMLEAFLKKTQQVDDFWSEFRKKDRYGIQKFLNTDRIVTIPKIEKPPFPAIGPFDVPVNVKPIVQLLSTFIDSIRLSAGLTGNSSTALTILLLLEELLTGQWRQALLTALGFLSPSGMAVGVIFKYLVNAWVLLNPDVRNELFKAHLRGAKSLAIGFLLWLATILPPNVILQPVEAVFANLRQKIEGFEEKVQKLENEGSKPLAPMKKRLKLSGIQFDTLKKISIHDIQNLQALATWDVLLCSAEFQDILTPIKAEPILRLVVELFNIPTTDDDTYKHCGPAPYKPIAEKVANSLKGQVVDDPDAPQTVVEVPKNPLEAFEALPEEAQEAILKEKLEKKEQEKPAQQEKSEEEPLNQPQPEQKGGRRRKRVGTKIQKRKSTPRRVTRRVNAF